VWLVPQLYNARRFELDLTPYPTIISVDDHCQTLDGIAAAHPSRQPDAPAM
jgi:maleylpyruvate isomerase